MTGPVHARHTVPDGHVHTEWSWDAVAGSMEQSCVRAAELGMPSIAFTDHADLTAWMIAPDFLPRLRESFRPWVTGGVLEPPPLDLDGYLACVQRCRDRFPGLRILSGVELSEPHWHPREVGTLLGRANLDRILGSVHSVRTAEGAIPVEHLYRSRPAEQVVLDYLAEVLRLIHGCGDFAVLAHVDYPVRAWPQASAGPFRPTRCEEGFREVLRALAGSGRALEVNTRVPLDTDVVRWWHEAGGSAVCFGSDAHEPAAVGRGFAKAAAVVEAVGFHPGGDPHRPWTRAALPR